MLFFIANLDTHITLKCKRCKRSNNLSSSESGQLQSNRHTFTNEQKEICVNMLRKIRKKLLVICGEKAKELNQVSYSDD